MFTKLATFVQANRRRILFAAVVGAAVAGVFGITVSKHMSPYGANDPATQSVQAMNRFQAAAGRQIDPGVVALVSPATRTRVAQVESMLRSGPDVVAVNPGLV